MEGEENNKKIISAEEMQKHYYWYFFYYNPDDDRVIVPKRCKWCGWTLNFGNRKGQFLGAGIFALLGVCVAYCNHNNMKCCYTFSDTVDYFKSLFPKKE